MAVPIRLGRNLQSLEFKSDPTDRATRIMPIAEQVAGANTFLGRARWVVTAVSTLTVALADPAGGAGPIAYDGQTVGWKLYSEKSATLTAISSATASANSVVVASVSNVATGDYVEFRDASGAVPYYLDHPTYTATSDPGIGVKFGTIDRSKIPGVANLITNSVMATWTTPTSMPDGWYTKLNAGSISFSQNTDPLYTQLGGKSLKVNYGALNQAIVTPPIAWTPEYSGQRFSARMRLFIPEMFGINFNWVGNTQALQLRLGIKKTDGSLKMWMAPSECATIVPPTSTVTGENVTKVEAGSWIDVAIQGLDITSPSTANVTSVWADGTTFGSVTAADLATQANISGYVVLITGVTAPSGGGCREFYIDGAMMTVGLEPPDTLTEFGGANQLWQSTNVVLGLLAPPQVSYSVDVVDLGRLNDVTADTFTLGGQVIVNDTELGVVNVTQRVVEIMQDELVPGSTRITLANRTRRLTDLLTNGSLSQSGSVTVGKSTTPTSGGNSSGSGTTGTTGGTTGGTGGTGSSGDNIVAAPVLTITLDSSNNWTATAVVDAGTVRVKFASSTSGMPSDDDVRAATSDTSAPFTATGGPLTNGQTIYVKAFAYDNNGVESPAGVARLTASAAGPTDYEFHYVASLGITTSGSTVTDWADQSGHNRNLPTAHLSGTPQLVTNVVNGQPVVRFDGLSGWQFVPAGAEPTIPGPSGDLTLFVVVSPAANPMGTLQAFGIGSNVEQGFNIGAGASGIEIGGLLNAPGNLSSTSTSYSGVGSFDVIVLTYDATANTATFYKNGSSAGTISSSDFGHATTGIGMGCCCATGPQFWKGDVAEAGGYYRKLSTSEIADLTTSLSVTYDVGGGGTPSTPTLSYAYSGGDVIITASAPSADSAKIDASLSGTPTATNVRATTALTVLPFSKTFAAPTGTDVLHAAAFAYIGSNESTLVTVNIPAEVTNAATDDDYVMWATSTALTNSRVLANSTTITWSTATAGLIKGTVVNANPSTIALGDIFYASSTNTVAVVTGNVATNTMVLTQTGTGTGSAKPVWVTMPAAGPSALSSLTDIAFTTLANSQILTYDSSLTKWKNASGGSGASALTSLSDVALTTLVNAQVLTYDSSLTAWKNATAAAASVPAWVTDSPDTYSLVGSENPADDQFGSSDYSGETSLDTGGTRFTSATAWAWRNQGSATATVAKGVLTIKAPSHSGEDFKIVEQALPGGTAWRIQCKAHVITKGAGEVHCGMVLVDSSSGKLEEVAIVFSAGVWTLAALRYSGVTGAWGGDITTGFNYYAAASGIYFAIERTSSTSFKYEASKMGVSGSWLPMGTTAPASYLTNVDKIGLCVNSNGNGMDVYGSFTGWRRVS